jgi:hypothetical protein
MRKPDRREAPARGVRERHGLFDQEEGLGGLVAPAHPPPQLVELREAVRLRAVDQYRVRGRDVEAVLDDRRREEHVGPAREKPRHGFFELPFAHRPVGDGHAHGGDELF